MNKLAIVIPYYKIDFLEEALQSIAAQTIKKFTLYIGNDASPNDPLPTILKCFAEEELNFYNYTVNLGGKNLALQWERILENVTEEWFHILGDDDMISENFVEEFYHSLPQIEENNINVIKVSQAIINEEGEFKTTFSQYKRIESSVDLWQQKIYEGHRSSLSEHIFRKSSYDEFHFKKFPLAWHSDDLAVLEFSNFGKVYFIENAQVFVRISTVSISGNTENKDFENQKVEARYQFLGFVINNYYKKFDDKLLLNLIDVQIAYSWKHQKSSNLNLYKLYGHLKNYKKILGIPRKEILLLTNSTPYLQINHYKKYFQKIVNPILYWFLIRYNKTIKKQRENPLSIPIIIINYNQLFYLKKLLIFLKEREFQNIVIIDNQSDYQPLLAFYKSIENEVTVEYMDENLGHLVFFKNKKLQKKYGKGYYVITDPDIVPNEKLPKDFMNEMLKDLDQYFNTITKVGFALDLETIPDYFPLKEKVLNWEKAFWEKQVEQNKYSAFIDTTFALYKPFYPSFFNNLHYLDGIRIAGNYTSIHGGWYIDPENYTDENLHYIRTVEQSSSWKLNEDGKHDNKGIAKYDT